MSRKIQRGGWIAAAVAVSLSLSACAETSDSAEDAREPATLEPVEGTDLQRVILTAQAAERLDVQTTEVREETLAGNTLPRTVIPYAAVIYDPEGQTWTYTNPEPLTYVRHRIRVDRIEDDVAVLFEGPPLGTAVVTVGVAELFGTEFEVGH